jgi:hypothetical protein
VKLVARSANKKRPRPPPTEIDVNVVIYEPVQPLDRGDRYEDPVYDALEEAGLGEEGDGGGTLCSEHGEIEQVDFDIVITSLEAIPLVTRVLEKAGAPKGSELRYAIRGDGDGDGDGGGDGDEHVVTFGACEGLAIYLDGITLPPHVYRTCDAKELHDRLREALGDDPGGECRGSWVGPRETALYFYGRDAEQMFARVESVLRAYPLSSNARVVIRHGSPAGRPREVRFSLVS